MVLLEHRRISLTAVFTITWLLFCAHAFSSFLIQTVDHDSNPEGL